MKMMLNSLPSRTWNRLGINESFITINDTFQDFRPEIKLDQQGISWNPDQKPDLCWEEIKGGAGADMDLLTKEASTGSITSMPDTKMEKPLLLTFDYKENGNDLSRLWFHAAKNSEISAIILIRSAYDAAGISAIQTKIHAEEGSHVHLYVVQLLGKDYLCLNDIGGVCEKDASIRLTKLDLGAGKAYSGAFVDLKGQASDFTTETGYHVHNGQLLDMNYVALHHGPKTTSYMEINGTLEDGAKKAFRGTIDFQKGSSGAKGSETENVLLLGDRMVNQSIPLILCKEEDVEGNHGASIGRLDEKVLFYLGTRGITESKAQHMIAQSKIDAICNLIPDESIREEVDAFEEQRRLSYDSGK